MGWKSVAALALAAAGAGADGGPALHPLGEFDSGLGAGNAEIVDVDPASGLAFLTCGDDRSVLVVDLADPAAPVRKRRDSLEAGEPTSVAVHPAAGWYAVAVRAGLPGGNDALLLRSVADGTLLRTFDLGFGRGPDAVAVSRDGKWIACCLEAEDPWMPGAVAFWRCDAAAPAEVKGPLEVSLDGLAPANGAFSTRWIDRVYNAPLAGGAAAATAAGAVLLVDGDTRASDPSGPLADGTEVTFRRGGAVAKGRFRWAGAAKDGEDGNVFVFPLDGSANSLEPEFAAFSPDGARCWVTLQENNALLEVDLTGSAPKAGRVLALGKVDAPADLKAKDPAKDSPARFADRLVAEREPDGLAVAILGGKPCVLTADEGDTWAPDASGKPRVRGGRTLSILDAADGRVLGDTGNALDAACDAAGRWGAFLEAKRAGSGGCEPENLDLVVLGSRTLAVVGLERANALALVDATDPVSPRVLGLEGLGGLSGKGVRKAPEGIRVIRRGERTLVLAAFEQSGTLGVFEIR